MQDIAFQVGTTGRCGRLKGEYALLQIGMATMILLLGRRLQRQPAKQLLPTGQAITPLAAPGARFTPLVARTGPHPSYVADGAAAIAVSPDKREMLVLTSGFNRYNGPDGKVGREAVNPICLSLRDQRKRRSVAADVAGAEQLRRNRVAGRTAAASSSAAGSMMRCTCSRGAARKFALAGKIALGHKAGLGADVRPQAAGVAVSPDGRRALVANYYNDSVSLVDLAATKSRRRAGPSPGKDRPCRHRAFQVANSPSR